MSSAVNVWSAIYAPTSEEEREAGKRGDGFALTFFPPFDWPSKQRSPSTVRLRI